jgi:hypothetical protein
MTTTFHIAADELNEDFIEKVKLAFGKKQLLITIEEDDDETFYLLSTRSNREKFKKSLNELERGDVVRVSTDELRK